MSAIDVAIATNSPNAVAGKAKAVEAGSDDNAFEQIYESVGRKSDGSRPASAKSEKKTQNNNADETATDTSAQITEIATDNLSSELAQLIGGSANMQAQASAQNNSSDKTSAPLRRDTFPHFATVAAAEEELKVNQEAPRLKIIGRETHFAPVNTTPNSKLAVQDKTAHSLIDTATETGKTNAAIAEIDSENLLFQKLTAAQTVTEKPESPMPRKSTTRDLRKDTENKSPLVQSAKTQAAFITDTMLPQEMVEGVLTRVADQLISHARDIASVSDHVATTQSSVAAQLNENQQGPVRILRLQLQPEELGMVTARLRMVGGVLELRLTADRQQSVEILQRDQEGLLETLRRAGYKAEIASIDFARPVGGQQAATQSQTNSGGGQPLSPGSEGFDGFNGTGHGAGEGQEKRQHATGRNYSEEHMTEGQGDGAVRQTRDPQAVYL